MYRTVRKRPATTLWREIFDLLRIVVAAIVIASVIRAFVFEPVHLEGPSMEPLLHEGQWVMVSKIDYYTGKPQRFDVVTCYYNVPRFPDMYIKRLIGLPGEKVKIIHGQVYIDDVPLVEPYVVNDDPFQEMAEITIPEGFYFVMGDNRTDSADSSKSEIGPIPARQIVGHGVFVFFPFDQWHTLVYEG